MHTFIFIFGWIAFAFGVFFVINTTVLSPENIVQQIYLAVGSLKAILCFLLFAACMICAKLCEAIAIAGKPSENKTKQITGETV